MLCDGGSVGQEDPYKVKKIYTTITGIGLTGNLIGKCSDRNLEAK
jgi:hypothetical protein